MLPKVERRFDLNPKDGDLHICIDHHYHALKSTLRALRSFHISSPKVQSENDSNIRIVTGKLPIIKFLFRVVEQKF